MLFHTTVIFLLVVLTLITLCIVLRVRDTRREASARAQALVDGTYGNRRGDIVRSGAQCDNSSLDYRTYP